MNTMPDHMYERLRQFHMTADELIDHLLFYASECKCPDAISELKKMRNRLDISIYHMEQRQEDVA